MAPLGYHAMRMRWCRVALWAFVRRWAVYFVTGAALLVAGMAGGPPAELAAVQGVCAWLVLPLFRASANPAWMVSATVLQAIAGGLLVWGMRPLLWPQRWAAAERALPLVQRDTLFSDCRVVPLGLLPLILPCALGAHALIASDPPWLHPTRGRAVLALCAALAGSVVLGVAILQWLRMPARPSGYPPAAPAALPREPAAFRTPPVTGWTRALLWWPLWRGPAQRSGRVLIGGSAVLCAPALGLLRWPGAGGWWLAAYALAALLVVTRLSALTRAELEPMWRAAAPLPLAGRKLQQAREVMAMVPLLFSGIALLACLGPFAPRPTVLAGFVLACVLSCVVEVRSRPADAAAKSSRWLFCVALMLALASEVFP